MRRERLAVAREIKRAIVESPWLQSRVARRGGLVGSVVSKIVTMERSATEAQMLQIAIGIWCTKQEVDLLLALLNNIEDGLVDDAAPELLRFLAFHNTSIEMIAQESGISKLTFDAFLRETVKPCVDEVLRIFVAAVVRDDRRDRINALLGFAGYYAIGPISSMAA